MLLPFVGSSCVVPLEPSFSDPASNYPPYIISANPVQTSVLSLANEPSSVSQIMVQVGDQNVDDSLYVRWLLDYPEASNGTESKIALEAILPPTGQAERHPIRYTPSCTDDHLSEQPIHRISMVVADRPYALPEALPQDKKWSTAKTPGFILESSWVLLTGCKNQQQGTH